MMSHLSQTQQEALQQQLEAQRSDLRAAIRDELTRSDDESIARVTEPVHDAGEESFADLLSEVNAATLGQSIRALREVEAALERLTSGHYGLCEECKEALSFERLQACPTARRCLSDQQRYEREHRDTQSGL